MNRRDLGHALRVRFGLAPNEPTDLQIDKIAAEIRSIRDRTPSDSDWSNATKRACPSFGSSIYKSIDNSDLNALLGGPPTVPKPKPRTMSH